MKDGWWPFVVMEKSIINKESAWKLALDLDKESFSPSNAGGNGNSWTNTLYFIATRPSALE
jgi:hypothetical protein